LEREEEKKEYYDRIKTEKRVKKEKMYLEGGKPHIPVDRKILPGEYTQITRRVSLCPEEGRPKRSGMGKKKRKDRSQHNTERELIGRGCFPWRRSIILTGKREQKSGA